MLQLRNDLTGMLTLEFFNYASGKYVHLNRIEAKQVSDGLFNVDDSRSYN